MTPNEGVTRILNLNAEQLDRAAELERLRREITVMFTDLKGSTSYFEKYGDAAGLLMVHRCNSLLGQAAERHGGRVIKTIGDAVMAAFEDSSEAVAASIEMQELITADNLDKPAANRISIRIGINSGLGIVKSDDIFGDVVNVASRVESAAAPEQILISDTLYKCVQGSARFRIRAVGKFVLKGKAEERDLYEVSWRKQEEEAPQAVSHSVIVVPDFSARVRYKLTQLRTDGQPGRECELPAQATIGRESGEFSFAADEAMLPEHARLKVESGQLFVEPVQQAPIYLSLIGPYRLQEGDVVRMGSQTLRFSMNTAALQAAARTGTGVRDLAAMLQRPIAEFSSEGPDRKHFAVMEGQTNFGRTKGAHIFNGDGAMSRTHARVYHRGEDFFIEDLGSTNGTYVLVRDKTLVPEGCKLAIGGQILKVSREA